MNGSRSFESFDKYLFEQDERFQQGIKQLDTERIQQAKYFYYRKFIDEQFEATEYEAWVNTGNKDVQSNACEPDGCVSIQDPPVHPLSFQEVMEKVARGETIPGVRQIPAIIRDVPLSKSAMEPRKKPWE